MTQSKSTAKRWPLHYQILAAMVAGTFIGVLINPGETVVRETVTARVAAEADAVTLSETAEMADGSALEVVRESFSSRAEFERSFPRLAEKLGERQSLEFPVTDGRYRLTHELTGISIAWRRQHDGVPAVSQFAEKDVTKLPSFWQDQAVRHPSGTAGQVTAVARFIGDLFLRLLKMVTVPLILTSLITGVAGLGQHGRFGAMFGRTIIYYVSTSMLAITTGIVLVNLIGPGIGAILPGGGRVVQSPTGTIGQILVEQIMRMIPSNPLQAMAEGQFLSIISFAIVFGMFINAVGGDAGRRLSELFEAAFHVMMRMTAWIIGLAPIGVGAFMVYATATQGVKVFGTLAWYMLTVFLALAIHALITLPLIVRFVAGRSPWKFAQAMTPSLLTAFSTASSNAALPLTMSCVEERAGVSNRTSSFVLPLGATINMDGTALYEAVAVLFIAQATPGFDLTMTQQITVAITALLASVGAAGIPHAGLVMMAIVLQAVGLPLEAQGVIIAVDRILDMCRTAVNVWSDSCGCAVIDQLTNGSTTQDEHQAAAAAAASISSGVS